MKLSKVLPMVALVLGTGLAATACGPATTPVDPSTKPSTPEQTEGTEINIWATAKEEAVIKAVVDEYNKTAKQTIRYKFTAVSEADAGTTLGKDPTVKGAPALFLCADDQIYNLQSKNIILEIQGSYKEKVIADNTPLAVSGATSLGKLYGFPVSADNGYFMWYNKAELPEDKLGSLEDILAYAKENDKTVLMDIGNGYYANSFIMSPQANGTESIKWNAVEGGVQYDLNWDNETAVKVSEYVMGLIAPYYADGTLQIGSNEQIAAGFQNNMIAAVSGTWMEKDLTDAIADDLGAAKLPSYHIDGKAYQMASFAGSKVLCVNKTRPVEEQKVAVKLAQLLTNKESQLIRFEKRATLPCNNEAILDARYTENVSVGGKALIEQSAFAGVQSKCAQDRYWKVGEAIGNAYLNGTVGNNEATGEAFTMAAFLKHNCDILRTIG